MHGSMLRYVQISAIYTKKQPKTAISSGKKNQKCYCRASSRASRWYCDGVKPVMRLKEVTNVERDLKPTLSLIASMV